MIWWFFSAMVAQNAELVNRIYSQQPSFGVTKCDTETCEVIGNKKACIDYDFVSLIFPYVSSFLQVVLLSCFHQSNI